MLRVITNVFDNKQTPIRADLKRFFDFDFRNWT